MSMPPVYLVSNGHTYIVIEESAVGREKASLRLAISLAREKLELANARMEAIDDESIDYEKLQDTKNDLELLVSGFTDRLADLANRPSAKSA